MEVLGIMEVASGTRGRLVLEPNITCETLELIPLNKFNINNIL